MTKTYYPSEKNKEIVRNYLRANPGWHYKTDVGFALRDAHILSYSAAYKSVMALIEEGEIEVEVRKNLRDSGTPHAGGDSHYIRLKVGGQ